MLYREIIAICSQIHTKHINTLSGQNVGLLNFKPGDTPLSFMGHFSPKDISHKHIIKCKLYHIILYNIRSLFVCKCQTDCPKESR